MSKNINDTELLEELVKAKNNFTTEIGKVIIVLLLDHIGEIGVIESLLISGERADRNITI